MGLFKHPQIALVGEQAFFSGNNFATKPQVLPVLGLVAANQGEDEAARQYFRKTWP